MNLRGAYLLVLVWTWVSAVAGETTPLPMMTNRPSTQPVMQGRDTPEGAMNVYEQALVRGDLATVADAWNSAEARNESAAKLFILQNRLVRALAAHLSAAELEKVRSECRISVRAVTRPFVADDWEHPQSDIVYPKRPPAMMMQRSEDGIWRFGRISRAARARTPEMAARRADTEQRQQKDFEERKKQLEPVIADLEAGMYAMADQVIDALYPEGSPMAKMRKFEAQEKAEEAKREAAEKQRLLAAHFDPATLEGAIGAFLQARTRRDRAGLERFYYADGDSKGRLAKANAQRLLSGIELEDAVKKQFGADAAESFAGIFALTWDAPEWFPPEDVKGDTAAGASPGDKKLHYRKVGGIWKEDITSSVPAAKRVEKMEQATAGLEKIVADVHARKYKTAKEVEEALKKAGVEESYHELEREAMDNSLAPAPR
jgi:hypothetical protein